VIITTAYDRANLIDRAVANLSHKLIEEMIVVALVCVLFLLHFRSSLVAIVTLPWGADLPGHHVRSGHQRQHHEPGGHRPGHRVMVDAA